jgi:hypothetical protein
VAHPRSDKESTLPNQVIHCRTSFPDGTTFEDTSSFGMTFQATTVTDMAPADIVAFIADFLNVPVGTATNAPCHYISGEVTRATNGIPILMYDVTDSLGEGPSGSPIFTGATTLEASGLAYGLPAQLAAVCAYRSAYGTDIEKGVSEMAPSSESAQDQGAPATHPAISKPRARDRGRLYLGPLSPFSLESLASEAVGSPGQLATTAYDDLLQALSIGLTPAAGVAGGPFGPVVWSRVAAAVKPIAFIALDAAVGVIRKRADTVINRVLGWTPTVPG